MISSHAYIRRSEAVGTTLSRRLLCGESLAPIRPPLSTGPMEQLIVRLLKSKIHPRAGVLFKALGVVEDLAEDWAAAKTTALVVL